jgi:serine/threonine protein kinase/tetratricopeptide (TPR) repeat protein
MASHLPPPPDDATVSGKPSTANGPGLARGATVGRYLLLDPLGQGGMGVVYKAYDPELDRTIALKLLRTSDGDGVQHDRLLREAQALARLQHPNVIGVHDVGTFRGGVFIAMDFVEGHTLRQWLVERPRSRRAILDTFLAAGEGLAAAHRAGLVHRDFKPDNVMVGDDGRVRVLDFGLARAQGAPTHDDDAGASPPVAADVETTVEARPTPPPTATPVAPPSLATPSESGHSGNLLATPITHAGAIVGTPRFMAPEQHLGDPTDERADQFSFCVSLYHALYGSFPFAADGIDALLDDVVRGRVAEPPPGANVPRWLRQVLVRGLAPRPEARHPSMDALLQALRADPAVVRRRWLRAAIPITLLAGVAVAFGSVRRQEVRACAGAARKLDGVWDEARRAAVRTAFGRSGKPYAAAALSTVERVFDGYARAWTTMHVDTCEATHVRHEQSQELLDLRMTCLADRLTQLKTLGDVYASADDAVVERAAQSAQSLPPLDACADVAALRSPMPPPRDLSTRQRVETVRQQLSRAGALRLAARYDEGLKVVRSALNDAEGLRYPPLEAEAQLRLGQLLGDHGDWADAAGALHRALVAGLAGHDDETAGWAASDLVQAIGVRQAHYEDGDRWADLAVALAGRLRARDELLGDIYRKRAEVRERQSKYDEALADAKRALELEERALGPDHLTVAGTYHRLGNIYFQRAQYPEALDAFNRSLAIRQRALGPDHPELLKTFIGMANVYGDSGDHERALADYQRALDGLRRTQPDDPDIPMIANNMGDEMIAFGRPAEALESYRTAEVDFRKRVGPSLDTTLALMNMGDALRALNRPEEALRTYARAEAEGVRVLGAEHQVCGQIQVGIGEADLRLRRLDEAATHFRRALTVGEKALGPTHPRLAEPLLGLGRIALARHDAASARAPLERALAIREAQPGDGVELAEIRTALAQAGAAKPTPGPSSNTLPR